MNTKIEELAKQAFDTIAPDDKEWFKTYSIKLTELIVKECTNMLPEDSIRNADGVHMFYVIREHFGVSAIGR